MESLQVPFKPGIQGLPPEHFPIPVMLQTHLSSASDVATAQAGWGLLLREEEKKVIPVQASSSLSQISNTVLVFWGFAMFPFTPL